MSEKKVLNTLSSYGTGFQVKVLHLLLTDKQFVQNVHDILDVEYFDSPASKWIVEEALRYYYKYHTTPTLESLQVEVKKIENEVLKVATVEQLKESLKASNEDKEYIEQEFSDFCKNQHLKKALLSSVELLGKGQYDQIRVQIDQALKAGQEKNIGHVYDKDIETRYREEERNPIATPWPNVNELLMGGLGRGDLGIIFGNPGGGKSWMLVNMGSRAVMNGFNVCHYTLELAEGYVGKRYDSIFTGIDVQQIHLHRQKVEETVNNLKGKLIVKEFPMGKCTSHMIESHIQKCKDLGYPPDLVIIDYIDLMKSNRNRQEAKDEIDDIYTSIKGMARELKVPIWSVSQVNRAGAKDDVIEGDKAAGSYNKMMIADFAMSLSRKRADKVNGTGRIHIMKNRYGSDGMTFGAKVNTSNGFIEIDTNEISEDEIVIMEQATSGSNGFKSSQITPAERSILAQKFYELHKQSV